MSHTPGPWTVHAWGDNSYEVNAADSTVCNVPGFHDGTADEGVSEHNARLIAAAPDLLAALKRAVSEANCAMGYSGVDAEHTLKRVLERVSKLTRVCETAIAKAEGRGE